VGAGAEKKEQGSGVSVVKGQGCRLLTRPARLPRGSRPSASLAILLDFALNLHPRDFASSGLTGTVWQGLPCASDTRLRTSGPIFTAGCRTARRSGTVTRRSRLLPAAASAPPIVPNYLRYGPSTAPLADPPSPPPRAQPLWRRIITTCAPVAAYGRGTSLAAFSAPCFPSSLVSHFLSTALFKIFRPHFEQIM
jgi:hypothetical protein